MSKNRNAHSGLCQNDAGDMEQLIGRFDVDKSGSLSFDERGARSVQTSNRSRRILSRLYSRESLLLSRRVSNLASRAPTRETRAALCVSEPYGARVRQPCGRFFFLPNAFFSFSWEQKGFWVSPPRPSSRARATTSAGTRTMCDSRGGVLRVVGDGCLAPRRS